MNTNKKWTWDKVKQLVRDLNIEVNDVKQMWEEIDEEDAYTEEGF